jgi:hypothetical protein
MVSQIMESEGDGNFNVMDFISSYISSMDSDDDEKSKMLSSLNKLYKLVISKEEDKKL